MDADDLDKVRTFLGDDGDANALLAAPLQTERTYSPAPPRFSAGS
jgi:hypothetical protein